MTCSFLFLTGKMSISSVFVTMLAFNLAVFPCPLFHKLKAQGAEKTADFLQFRHEALSSVACPIPLSLIHGFANGPAERSACFCLPASCLSYEVE